MPEVIKTIFDYILENKDGIVAIATAITGGLVFFKAFPKMIIDGTTPDNLYIFKSYEQLYKHANFKRNVDWFLIIILYLFIGIAAFLSNYDSSAAQAAADASKASNQDLSLNQIMFLVELVALLLLIAAALIEIPVFAFLSSKNRKKHITAYENKSRLYDSILFMTVSLVLMVLDFFAFSIAPITKDLSVKNVLIFLGAVSLLIAAELAVYGVLLDKHSELRHLAKGYYEEAPEFGSIKKYIFYTEKSGDDSEDVLCGDIADAERINTLYHADAKKVKEKPIHIIRKEIYDQIKAFSAIKQEEHKLGEELSKIATGSVKKDKEVKWWMIASTGKGLPKIYHFNSTKSSKKDKNDVPENIQKASEELLAQQINDTESEVSAITLSSKKEELKSILDKMCHEVLTKEEAEKVDTYYYNLVKHVTLEVNDDAKPDSNEAVSDNGANQSA